MEIWRREKGSTILLAILVLAAGSPLLFLGANKTEQYLSAIAQEASTRLRSGGKRCGNRQPASAGPY